MQPQGLSDKGQKWSTLCRGHGSLMFGSPLDLLVTPWFSFLGFHKCQLWDPLYLLSIIWYNIQPGFEIALRQATTFHQSLLPFAGPSNLLDCSLRSSVVLCLSKGERVFPAHEPPYVEKTFSLLSDSVFINYYHRSRRQCVAVSFFLCHPPCTGSACEAWADSARNNGNN